MKQAVQRKTKAQLARDMKAAQPDIRVRDIAKQLGIHWTTAYQALQRKPRPVRERPRFTRQPVVYLTTQEVANILGAKAESIQNRVTGGHLQPAARAGKFSRALHLWTEDQLPDVRRALIEHAVPGLRAHMAKRFGGGLIFPDAATPSAV